jgi:AAA+ ATPase superfamily predicted ATPase
MLTNALRVIRILINLKNCVQFENEIFLRGVVMSNTTRSYEIAENFSPHFTRIYFLDNFHECA